MTNTAIEKTDRSDNLPELFEVRERDASSVNCPFYGYSLNYKPYPPDYAILLWPTGANQCALANYDVIACQMEVHGEKPDHSVCPLVKKVQTPPGWMEEEKARVEREERARKGEA